MNEATIDREVGRYALRTFTTNRGRLGSVAQGSFRFMGNRGHWAGGVCEARCVKNQTHDAPEKDCTCGIYGMLSIDELLRQYLDARHSVAVIAAEGKSFLGTKGLRTQAARIVAYWCVDFSSPNGHWRAYARDCPDVSPCVDLSYMLRAYGFDPGLRASTWQLAGRLTETVNRRPASVTTTLGKLAADVMTWQEMDALDRKRAAYGAQLKKGDKDDGTDRAGARGGDNATDQPGATGGARATDADTS